MSTKFLPFMLCALALSGCGSRILAKGEIPQKEEGVVFLKVALTGAREAKIHIFRNGNTLGPHASRIDAEIGTHVYAVALPAGTYQLGQISAGGGTNIKSGQGNCEPFSVKTGRSTNAGLVSLTIAYPKYQIGCATDSPSQSEARTNYESEYPALATQFPIAP